MLSSEACGLIVKIAKGIIKLTRQIDLVMAEKYAVQGELALAVPVFVSGLTPHEIITELTDFCHNNPELTEQEKTQINDICTASIPAELERAVETYLPDLLLYKNTDLESDFIKRMKEVRPEWAGDNDIILSAYFIRSGKDERNKSYKWRLALTVVDVLAEFGAENMALFTRDKNFQNIIGAILARFAESDMQKLDSNRQVFKSMISATLNGLLDAEKNFDIDNKWAGVIIDSLSNARESLPLDRQDEFLMGLIMGKSYPVLVAHILSSSADSFDDTTASEFTNIASDFLKQVSLLIINTGNTKFSGFFNDHWGDILRAGFKSAEAYGPELIRGDSPLLAKVLGAVAENLAGCDDNLLLSSDMVAGIVNAGISAIAENPDLACDLIDQDWLSALVNSVTGSIADAGIRAAFTKKGLEIMAKDLFGTFALHPELIIERQGIPQELLKSILTEFKNMDGFSREALAIAAVSASLKGISEHPELIKLNYPRLIASIAGKIGLLVKEKKISGIHGTDLIGIVSMSLEENPGLFNDLGDDIVSQIITLTITISKQEDVLLISGGVVMNLVQDILGSFAAHGRKIMTRFDNNSAALTDQFAQVLRAGVSRAGSQLGKRIGVSSVAPLLGKLIKAWVNGELHQVDPDSNEFKIFFDELVKKAA